MTKYFLLLSGGLFFATGLTAIAYPAPTASVQMQKHAAVSFILAATKKNNCDPNQSEFVSPCCGDNPPEYC
jgi:hypothetical protein